MTQLHFFNDGTEQALELPGANVVLLRRWLAAEAATELYRVLLTSLPWTQPQIFMAGRSVAIPRLQAWIGEEEARYRYSGSEFTPRPWSAELKALKSEVERACRGHFNSVLANLYRDGSDSVAYHADDERELGCQPLIASLSLGATRRFLLRTKRGAGFYHPGCALDLAHGDLLIMAEDTQRNWQHSVPKTRKPCSGRINLTFRQINRTGDTHKGS